MKEQPLMSCYFLTLMTKLLYLCLDILIPQGTDCVKRVDEDVGNNVMESDEGDIITISDDEDEPGQCISLDKGWTCVFLHT